MKDKAKQLTKALPDLLHALNQVLTNHNLDDIAVDHFTFILRTPVVIAGTGNDEQVVAGNAIPENDHIPLCPPPDELTDCITCRDASTGKIVFICPPGLGT